MVKKKGKKKNEIEYDWHYLGSVQGDKKSYQIHKASICYIVVLYQDDFTRGNFYRFKEHEVKEVTNSLHKKYKGNEFHPLDAIKVASGLQTKVGNQPSYDAQRLRALLYILVIKRQARARKESRSILFRIDK